MKITLANSGLNGLQAGNGTTFFFFFPHKELNRFTTFAFIESPSKKNMFFGMLWGFFFFLDTLWLCKQIVLRTQFVIFVKGFFWVFFAWRLPAPAEVGGFDMFKHTGIKPCQSFEAHLVNKLGHHAQHQPCEMLSLCCRWFHTIDLELEECTEKKKKKQHQKVGANQCFAFTCSKPPW